MLKDPQTTVHLFDRFVFRFPRWLCSLHYTPCEWNFHTNCRLFQLDGNSGLLYHNPHILLLENVRYKYISVHVIKMCFFSDFYQDTSSLTEAKAKKGMLYGRLKENFPLHCSFRID